MTKKILHITDLHLNDFEGNTEFIRRRFFEEYLDKLVTAINDSGIKTIDVLVLTGDFVDRGKVENFEYIKNIINYLCAKLGISESNVCCTIGNHDYKWKEEVSDFSTSVELRKPYYDFASAFDGEIAERTDRFLLKKVDEDTYFLSLDSTLRSTGGAPGKIDDSEIDAIVHDALKKHLNENSTLLIGCHFPITSDENNFLASEEPNWHANHVWTQAAGLHDRIKSLKFKNIIWFHGDVHASDKKSIENSTYILTGRFSGNITTVSEFPRQCALVEIDDSGQKATTYSFISPTHTANPHTGRWGSSASTQIREVSNTNQSAVKISNDPRELKVIDEEIESQIIENISNDELFKFGRFKTSEKYSSIGWINVNKLMNSPVLLSRINEKSFKHIKEITNAESSKVILIGLEVIGGIIASQVSVRTNTINFILPIRGNKKFYSTEETSTEKLEAILPTIEEVVVFIDVIASGNTMSEFVTSLIGINPKLKIHVISVLTNSISFIKPEIPGVTSYATFCHKLKIPLVENQYLPDESILPATLDFT